jgi:uncharacterized lipoprotein NlpE involved in copper resistance
MKKIIVLASIAAFALVGCSSQSEPAPTVTITQAIPAPSVDDPEPAPAVSNEELYLIGLRAMGNRIIDTSSDSDLLEVGYSVCDALDAGFSTDEIIAYLAREMVADGTTSDVYAEAVGYIIGAADSALCPGSSTF